MSVQDLNFVSEPPEDFNCPICVKVLLEPHVTECCGQHFCEQCLTAWFKEQPERTCPQCRTAGFTHIRYLPMKRKINELLVYCSNRSKGCTVIVTVAQHDDHVGQCPYAEVKCPNNCDALRLLRKDLNNHTANTCIRRLSRCVYCQKQDEYYLIVGHRHQLACPDFPVGCPKNCPNGSAVKRRDLRKHQEVCPLEHVQCPRCQSEMLRQQLTDHQDKTCLKRLVDCSFCAAHVTFDTMDQHMKVCPEYPITCPRECDLGYGLKRKDLRSHSEVCPLEPVTCTKCKEVVTRQLMSEHNTNKCPKRSTQCKYCNMIGEFDFVTGQHIDECEEYPTGCPRRCRGSNQLKRKNLQSHAKVCLLEPVECPFSEVGCNTHLVRRDLNDHVKSNLEHHMMKVMTAHMQLVSDHRQLKEDHEKLNNEHSKLNDEFRKLKAEMAESQPKQRTAKPSPLHVAKELKSALSQLTASSGPRLTACNDTHTFSVPEIAHQRAQWSSPPFYVLEGYKMCLVLERTAHQLQHVWYTQPNSLPNTSSIKVSLQLMNGENDDQLNWPIDSPLALRVEIKSRSAPRHQTRNPPSGHQKTTSLPQPLTFTGPSMSTAQVKFTSYLDHRSQTGLHRVERGTVREIKSCSLRSTGPWTVVITLTKSNVLAL